MGESSRAVLTATDQDGPASASTGSIQRRGADCHCRAGDADRTAVAVLADCLDAGIVGDGDVMARAGDAAPIRGLGFPARRCNEPARDLDITARATAEHDGA